MLARATDVSVGVAQPEEFSITLNSSSYLTANENLTLGLASVIFDVRTMKMVWSYNGQGMLSMKGDRSAIGNYPKPHLLQISANTHQ